MKEQYIDKSALAAEIEKIKSGLSPNFYEYDYDAAKVELLEKIEKCLDTLEVKYVDFETEWKKYFEHKGNLATVNVKDITKHFFELGLKAQKGK